MSLALSEEYVAFRSSVPLRRLGCSKDPRKFWKLFDAGPKEDECPVVFLGPVTGTADVFYMQILNLSSHGVRVISIEGPVYWTVEEWCEGFRDLLDDLGLARVHLFGASLGGFLAQKFVEYTKSFSRVASLILCNSFSDTAIFNYKDYHNMLWLMPSLVLKKIFLGNFATNAADCAVALAEYFMKERLDTLSQQELASRLTMNCRPAHVDAFKLRNMCITLIDVFSDSAVSNQDKEDMHHTYSQAKKAYLKSGGNFPYLSRSQEVNMHILIHLRRLKYPDHPRD